ncbi:bifunctional deaminase-reductase domain protein [Kribbella flavida DSM 17836]|uniref:Bifunctional deaminase-reductase domain protein n=1 Tax=Kribbella flavida (strain DSM 17836 / JCM 10339 / NBRC 14399) TaxID=479435 RepID=D2Q1J3_KRIFD|nr:dihydrofolate reductase family protein [Kribbella flavida]ADB30181.1 bifunctional deaminase-reductase domain protein [Kribbella flavida DSM 17836]
MSKVSVVNFQSVDGVIQSVLSADEDREGGFEHGGWVLPYSDEVVAGFMQEATVAADGLLLGRKTYEQFAAVWPSADQSEPAIAAMNRVPKYVASRTLDSGEWSNTVILGPDVAAQVAELKGRPGNDLVVFGSGELLRTLLAHRLVDELHLLTFPLVIGTGKKMFGELPEPMRLTHTASKLSPRGVSIASYTVQ